MNAAATNIPFHGLARRHVGGYSMDLADVQAQKEEKPDLRQSASKMVKQGFMSLVEPHRVITE